MQLKVNSTDEIGVLTEGVNKLISKLRDIISDIYGQAGHVAISSCRTMAGIERLAAAIFEQKELAASVAVASEEMSATLNDVAITTAKASTLSQQVDESAVMINSIATATEEQSATTSYIASKIHLVSETLQTIQTQMEKSVLTFGELTQTAEKIYTTVGKFKVGNYHDTIKAYAVELRDRAVEALESAVSSGRIGYISED